LSISFESMLRALRLNIDIDLKGENTRSWSQCHQFFPGF
jgi:hypothetical protein